MNFTLYDYVLSGNCYKIRLLASLLDIQYESIAVDFHPGQEHKNDKILALNPAGTLPILVADNLVLTESQAMLSWMASKFDSSGQWFPVSEVDKLGRVMQWLGFSADLSATVGEARLHSMLYHPIDFDKTMAASTQVLRRLEAHLTAQNLRGEQWIAADHPTIADIACFPYTALSPDAGLEHDDYPVIRNWLYAIRSLEGFLTMPGIHAVHELRNSEADNG